MEMASSAELGVAEPGAFEALGLLRSAMRVFDHHCPPGPVHGNRRLHDRSIVGLLLCAAFEPAVRSLRSMDDLSGQSRVAELIGTDRAARSTLSDRLASFDAERLRPLIEHLMSQQPLLRRIDADTDQVARRIIAADGSWWALAGEVTHALQMNRGRDASRRQSRVRLNLQLDVDSFLPVDCDVSGQGDGSEAAALARRIHRESIYLIDRGYVHFGLIHAILDRGSNLVLRLKKSTCFAPAQDHELTERDRVANVLLDQTGRLCGPISPANHGRASRTVKPPAQTLRRIVIRDGRGDSDLILLTDLLDVPAYVIATLYRLRWQIELFLRWLKVFAGFDHLISQSAAGITTQFYVAVLATLLIHLASGRTRVSKHALRLVAWAATGRLPLEKMAEAMARHERERMLERARIAKKKATI